MGGEIIRLGGKHLDTDLYDLIGLMTGSEGLLGVVTEVTVRILKKPQVARGVLLGFPTVEAGCDCVAAIIAAGIIPGGMEMMDNKTIVATEDFQPCGYPRDAGSLVIAELDGTSSEVDHLIERVSAIAEAQGATTIKVSTSDEERVQFWQGRKNAFPAVGAIGPDYLCMDGTIPRNKLAYVLERMEELGKARPRSARRQRLPCGRWQPASVDPLRRVEGWRRTERAEAFGADILRLCVEVGGVLTGEHGVGVEKARPDGDDVHRGRPAAAAARQMRLRSGTPAQPRKGVPDAASLRRTGEDACASRQGGVSGATTVLGRQAAP